MKPELVTIRSFDNLQISGYLYRPDPAKFPGPRPVIINIHGGPESEYVPEYAPGMNYYLNELGVAMLFPNVRGSTGFGEDFANLDNGFKREDAVKDIARFLDWIGTDHGLDSTRVAVAGGSYGGYMVLAALYHYSNRLRCGSDEMGITDFVTFLKHTEAYRQAGRRYEYGDERYPDMCSFLESISPLNHVAEIGDPVMITAGKNDPRVPVERIGPDGQGRCARRITSSGTSWRKRGSRLPTHARLPLSVRGRVALLPDLSASQDAHHAASAGGRCRCRSRRSGCIRGFRPRVRLSLGILQR